MPFHMIMHFKFAALWFSRLPMKQFHRFNSVVTLINARCEDFKKLFYSGTSRLKGRVDDFVTTLRYIKLGGISLVEWLSNLTQLKVYGFKSCLILKTIMIMGGNTHR